MDLPDLRAKVKVDTSGMTEAEARLAAFSATVKRELENNPSLERFSQQAGQAFVKFGKDGEVASVRISSATAKTRGDLDQLEQRTKKFADSLDTDFRKGSNAIVRLGEDGSASLAKVTQNMQANQTAATQAAGGLASFGLAVVAVVAAVVVLAAALAPAVTILTVFAVGLTATLTALVALLAPITAIAAGVVILANATGHVNTPMQMLADHAKKMADALGKEAAPMAAVLIRFLDSLLPKVRELGSELISWFGAHLPAVMSIASQATALFFAAMQHLGTVIGQFVDRADFNKLWPVFAQSLDIAIGAIGGLLSNLLALSDFFVARLPTWGPIVGQIMSSIGGFIHGVGVVSGAVADWFVAHWPQITKTADQVGSALGQMWATIVVGWNFAQPALNLALLAFHALGPVIQFIRDHADSLRPTLLAVGVLFAVMAASAILTAATVVVLVAAIVGLIAVVSTVVSFLVSNFMPAVHQSGDRMSQLGSTAHAVADDIGAAFSWMGTQVHGVLDAIGGAFSALGSTAHGVVSAVGSAFSAFGSTVRGIADDIGGALAGLAGAFSAAFGAAEGAVNSLLGTLRAIPGAVGSALSSIPGVSGALGALHGAGIPGFQHGGVALPGSLFRVGEGGPEMGYALPGGGVVISPGAGGGGPSKSITVNISGATMGPLDERAIVALIRRYDLLHG